MLWISLFHAATLQKKHSEKHTVHQIDAKIIKFNDSICKLSQNDRILCDAPY